MENNQIHAKTCCCEYKLFDAFGGLTDDECDQWAAPLNIM